VILLLLAGALIVAVGIALAVGLGWVPQLGG
jgi:hypothetical protein